MNEIKKSVNDVIYYKNCVTVFEIKNSILE